MSDSMPPADDRRRRPGQSAWDVMTASLMVNAGLPPTVARHAASELIFDLWKAGHGIHNDNIIEAFVWAWLTEHDLAVTFDEIRDPAFRVTRATESGGC